MARSGASASAFLRVRTASAVVVMCLIAVSVSTPSAAASTARSAREKTGIAWTRCTEPPAARSKQFQCAKVPVPLDWDRTERQEDRAGRDPPPRQPTPAADRVDVRQPGRTGPERRRPGGERLASQDFDAWGEGRFDLVGWDPRGTNRSSPVECFTSQAAEDRFWAGVSIPDHAGRVGGLPAQDRRAGAPLR